MFFVLSQNDDINDTTQISVVFGGSIYIISELEYQDKYVVTNKLNKDLKCQ